MVLRLGLHVVFTPQHHVPEPPTMLNPAPLLPYAAFRSGRCRFSISMTSASLAGMQLQLVKTLTRFPIYANLCAPRMKEASIPS
jgi:hypothetical protein